MKRKNIITTLLIALVSIISFASCAIKDDVASPEADIISVTIDTLSAKKLLRKPVITNNEVRLYTNDLATVKISFELTKGATSNHVDSVPVDLSKPYYVEVTSENKQYKKTYKVYFVYAEISTAFHFETAERYKNDGNDYYETLTEINEGKDTLRWASGNQGFMLVNSTQKDPKSYPTALDDNGYMGKCVKLVTRSTGFWGSLFGSPMAAGNLFLGNFKLNTAQPLKSTQFGIPYTKEPLSLTGYYKYQAGKEYKIKGSKLEPNKKDAPAIYAVLFETSPEVPYLDGTNSLTHPNIVKIARLTDAKETSEWVPFTIPFTFLEGKTIDRNKMVDGKYSLAIILSSSEDGGNFNGAVGSTLWVDELIINEK